MTKQITFSSDRITTRGPSVDGGYTVSFAVGQYMQHKVAELLSIPQQTVITVTVEYGDIELSTQPEWMAHEMEHEQALIAGAQPTYGADQQSTS
jgi:hypothetical protein